MKIVTLFDDEGNVIAMMHPAAKAKGKGAFRPGAGQHAAELEVPADLQHLKPEQLHSAVRVEKRSGSPHMVAR